MKTLVVIQARWGSTRLPGKARADIGALSALEHVVRRARHKGYATCVAAPPGDSGALLWSADFRQAVPDNRGATAFVPLYFADTHEDDVLGRVAQTAIWADQMSRFVGGEGFGCIVRLTADCPFVPVAGIDAVAEAVTSGECDYSETRSDPSTRPNGIDAQAFTLDVLLRATRSEDPEAREHMTGALLEASEKPGRVQQLEGLRLDDVPYFRITLDTATDLEVMRRIAEAVPVNPTAGRPTLVELVALHRNRPEVFGEVAA